MEEIREGDLLGNRRFHTNDINKLREMKIWRR